MKIENNKDKVTMQELSSHSVGHSMCVRRRKHRMMRITNYLDSLDRSSFIKLADVCNKDKTIVTYIVAIISEYARTYNLTIKEASNYMTLYKGIDFLTKHYEAEHLLSIDDSVQDVAKVCYNNGGGII